MADPTIPPTSGAPPAPPTVRLIDPDGVIRDVPTQAAGGLLEDPRWRVPTREDELGRLATQATDADYGGAGNAVAATALGVARGATLGGSDLAARLLGGEDTAYDLEQLKAAHQVGSIGGEIIGTIAPAIITGGASLPASLATRVGERVGERVAERIGSGLVSKGIGTAAEGAIYGLGSGVSELSLSQDPLTVEHAASVLSSNALFGGGVGAAAGAAGHLIERGLVKAKGSLDAALAKSSGPAEVAGLSPEVAALDETGVRSAYDAEHASLTEARLGERRQFVEDLAAQRAAGAPAGEPAAVPTMITKRMKQQLGELGHTPEQIAEMEPAEAWAKINEAPNPSVSIFTDQLDRTNAKLDKALADPEGLARNPAAVARHLEHQESSYKSLITSLDDAGRDTSAAEAGLAQARAMRERIAALHEPVGSPKLDELRRARQVDPSTLDRAGLKRAEDFELDAIHASQQPEREAFVQDFKDAYRRTQEDRVWNFTKGHEDAGMRGLGKEALSADITIRKALGNEAALARDPGKVLDALERQAQTLERIQSLGSAEHTQYTRDFDRGPATIRAEMAAGKIDGYKVGKGGLKADSPLIEKGVREEMVKRFGGADRAVLTPRLKAWEKSYAALDRNRELQAAIKKLKAEPTSPYLEAVRAARETHGAPPAPSLGGAIIGAVAPFAGPIGVAAATGSKLLGGLRKAVGGAAIRGGKAASAFLDVAAKATKKAAPYAPVTATKALSALRYAPSGAVIPGAAPAPTGASPLAAAYLARSNEIKSQTEYDATGVPKMRPEARAAIADRLRPIGAVDPVLADRLESKAAARIEYLSSILPRRPDMGGMQVGPDRYVPPDMVMRSWAKAAMACEDPYAVLERAAHGKVSIEEVKALRAVCPEVLADFTSRVTQQAPTLSKTMPYQRQLALWTLTGVPVHASMTPAVMRTIQGMYAAEPGTAGGTQAPRAQAKFGSMKRSDPGTASQQRQEHR